MTVSTRQRVSRRLIERRHPPATYDPDSLPVTCWCEAEVFEVPRAVVLALQTVSCGLSGCRPVEEEHSA